MRSPFSRIGTWIGVVTMASLLSACVVQRPYGYGQPQQPYPQQQYPQQQYPQQQYPQQPQQPAYGYEQQPAQGVMEYGVVSHIEAIPRTVQRGSTSGVGAILGAVIGGVVGNQVEGRRQQAQNYQISVRLDNGEYRTVVQDSAVDLRPGNRVRVVDGRVYRY